MTALDAHHVGLTVGDLEQTLPFYRDVLDLEVLDRFSVEGEAFADAVGVDDAGADFVHLDANGVRLELVEYDPETDPRPAPELNEPGATHVGLAVDDLEAFYADLPEDVPTISEPRTTASGTSIWFLRDPEGNLVEVLET
ncbi:VOC family protein [Natronococcus sp. A-GB7]|uniref:VOC family protein n=1 Tax=Natronococcus sp. A-GB7 TaxID=3037649 RepID=UPI00241E37EB|nr:VOC family protein [Natronococcus sp. A-GB7]MDG5819832.1 VOC family protein [Natronococcus sp. A-GB7]